MIGIIMQARMGAKRLPGKVLKEVDGIPLLQFEYERVKKSKMAQVVVVATTDRQEDQVIEDFCQKFDIPVFRGSENDVLSRYYECAKKFNLTTIVRVTGDCPLIDPDIIDKTIDFFFQSRGDFTGNTIPPESSRFPDGSDVEVFSMKSLERAYQECTNAHFREHVTFYFWKENNNFKVTQYTQDKNYSKYRLTIDYPEDLEVISFLIRQLKSEGKFGHLDEVIEILERNKEIKDKNSMYYFGIGWKQ